MKGLGWPTDKILRFRKFLDMFRIFLVLRNNFFQLFSFYNGFFHKNPEN